MGNSDSAPSQSTSSSEKGPKASLSGRSAFYGVQGGEGGGTEGNGSISPPSSASLGGKMARATAGTEVRLPDSPELQAAIAKVRVAINADTANKAEEALQHYQDAVGLFLNVMKRETDQKVRDELKRRVSDYLDRAEALKGQIASRPLPAPPQGSDKKKAAPLKPVVPTRKQSLDGRRKPDDYDYTSEAKKLPSAATGGGAASGAHKRSQSGPIRTGVGAPGRGLPGRTASGGRGGGLPSTAAPPVPGPGNELEALIMNEMLDRSPNVRWDDIAGLESAKQTLQEAVVLPNLRPDLFTGLRSPPKGVLLFGPPGTGKTLLAKAVASESGFAFFSISASSLVSKYLGDGEKMVRALFSVARKLQPSVIFMDEIDSMLGQRRDNEHEASRRLKTEFLVQLDGAATDSADRILVMGATNLPWALDEAVLRRLVKKVYIPLPDTVARKALIRHLLSSQKQGLKDSELNELVRATDSYSCSDLTAMCKEAAMQPIRDLGANIRTASLDELRPLRLKDFLVATTRIRPSVSAASIEQFEEWHRHNGY